MKKKAKISQEEAYELIRRDLRRHNDRSHHEDCFTLWEWLDECIGNTYGNWIAVRSEINEKVILVDTNVSDYRGVQKNRFL